MKRNCCECLGKMVSTAVMYSDARMHFGHSRDERTSLFPGANFSGCCSHQKAPDSKVFSTLAGTFKTCANVGSAGTLVANGKALQSTLWKRRTEVYQKQ